ncbi:MAG TPA: translesion DNA synthesis-associated protein ImuA [Rhodanobacteraceae bacterium]|nr:translesion DNA synthesis-associated protein ImuA [Rhodanobacteraceae bacterium]
MPVAVGRLVAFPEPSASGAGAPTAGGLTEVLRHPGIWRRTAASAGKVRAEPTGCAELDALLPGGGWPRGALSEILVEHDGLGEFSLLAPALAALTRARRRVVLVAPPYIPYPPALAASGIDLSQLVHIGTAAADTHWTAEQCLRAGCCGAVLHWLPTADYRQLRRLQLAAETGDALGFVLRPLRGADQASPAALRLAIRTGESGTCIELLKCRGGFRQRPASVRLRA